MRNNRRIKTLAVLGTSILTLAAIGFFGGEVKEVKAIDINDYSACESAYKSGSATSLYQALQKITSEGQAGSYKQLWDTYKKAYVKSNGKIFDYYSNKSSFTPGTDQAGNYSGEGDKYNREHSIPKSWWGGEEKNQGADPYIVVPTDGWVNAMRSNFPFGYVSTVKKQSSGGFSKLGTSTWGGYNGTVFEPDNSVKGDFARIYFYAIAKYNTSSWQEAEGSTCFTDGDGLEDNFGLTAYSVKLFSAWSELDPVSDWERSVNNAIAPIQGNRNPFVDHPEYANVLWGGVTDYTTYTHNSGSTVDPTPVASLNISNTSIALETGESFTLTATTSDGSKVSWKSSNTSVATVDSNGKVVAVGGGYATITATAVIGGKTLEKVCEVSVTEPIVVPVLESITLDNVKNEYEINSYLEMPTVYAHYSDNTTVDVTNSVEVSEYAFDKVGVFSIVVTFEDNGVTKTASFVVTVTDPTSGDDPTPVVGTVYTKITDIDDLENEDEVVLKTESGFGITGLESGNSNAKSSETPSEYLKYVVKDINVNEDHFALYDTEAKRYIGMPSDNKNTFFYDVNSSAIYFGDNGIIKSNNHTLCKNGTYCRFYKASTSITDYELFYLYKVDESGNTGETIDYELDSITVEVPNSIKTFVVGDEFTHEGIVVTAHYTGGKADKVVTDLAVFSKPDMTVLGEQQVVVGYLENDVAKIVRYTINIVEASATSVLESITVDITNAKTTYILGDAFRSTGVIVTAHYTEGKPDAEVEAEFVVPDMTTTGKKTVAVSYTEGGVNKATTYEIIIVAPTVAPVLNSITVNTNNAKLVFTVGETFTSTGIVVTAHYSNGGADRIVNPAVTAPDMTTAGTKVVNLVYFEDDITKTTSYTITVNEQAVVVTPVLNSITISVPDAVKTFTVDDTFSHEGVVVTAHYTEGKADIDVTSKAIFSTPNMSTAEAKTITVSYTENNVTKEATYTITVNAKAVDIKALQDAAIASLREYYNSFDLSKYDANGRNVLLETLNNGVINIRAATTEADINQALSSAKTIMDAVRVITNVQTNKGCLGNVQTTSVIISALALVGIALIILKRKNKETDL